MTAHRGYSALLVLVLSATLSAVGISPARAAAPGNDDFENAEALTFDEFYCQNNVELGTRSLAEATAQAGEPAHHGTPAAHSIWFTGVPTVSGTASMEARLRQAGTVRLAAYTGTSLATLVPIAGDEGTYASAAFDVVAGEQVWFAIDTAVADASLLYGKLRLPYHAENDDPSRAQDIEGERGRTQACPPASDGPSEYTWYRWTAPRTGFMSFGIGHWDSVAVFSGSTDARQQLARADSGGSDTDPVHSRVYADFWAVRGSTYHVRVATQVAGGTPEVLTWRPGTDYPNPRADFDRNGCEDLVVGAPGENMSGARDTGAVVVRYGCRDKTQRWHQDNDGTASTPESGDRFGHALAAGDFDRDGYADLAIGVPGEDIGTRRDTGTVIILRGSSSGLTTTGAKRLTQTAASGPLSRNEAGDSFGWALASREHETPTLIPPGSPEPTQGDSDYHGPAVAPVPPVTLPAQLLIGAPGEDHSGERDAGTLGLHDQGILRTAIESSPDGDEYRARNGGLLGSSIATGGLQDHVWPDRVWVAGQPGAAADGQDAAGRIVYTPDFRPNCSVTCDKGANLFGIRPRAGDRLGSAVAAIDNERFGGGGASILVVGIPGRDVDGVRNAGMIVTDAPLRGEYVHTKATRFVPGSPKTGDRFGASLAAGFLDTDRLEDLIIGVPGENVDGDNDAGAVMLFYGYGNRTRLHRDSWGMGGDTRPGDRFGTTVGAIDFDGDTKDEVVVGAPLDDIGRTENAGSVVLRRSSGNTSVFLTGSLTPGGAEPGDQFGAALLQ